jgi:DNA-nicking Smr family endonuclease
MAKRPRSVADDERQLFERAVADVRPLEHDQRRPASSTRAPVPLSDRDKEVLQHLDALVAGDLDFELHDSDEFAEGSVPGLDPRVLSRLRGGEFARQADLDLHGTTAESARALVERFVVDSHARGLRCLRIVHGRGRNSPGGVAVLKQSLPRWLQRGPARHLVLAWSTARPRDGGAGASYVLLRKGGRRPRRQPL